MVREEQDHEYLKNGKRCKKYQKTDPQNMPMLRLYKLCFIVYIHIYILSGCGQDPDPVIFKPDPKSGSEPQK